MADPELHRALRESVEEVLEKMFFVRPIAPMEESGRLIDLYVRLGFDGDPPGYLVLGASRRAARSIAADFLADDEQSLTDQQTAEVICELANMICGSVLSRIESSATFRLGAPEVISTREAVQAYGEGVEHGVELGNGAISVSIHMEAACRAGG
ncbi:MAG TPA: chemotaxis protein CheX [Bryobacteraceae bacterium]|nr:chemotaxis protein CheX [Bryobacteraceae bacterium]